MVTRGFIKILSRRVFSLYWWAKIIDMIIHFLVRKLLGLEAIAARQDQVDSREPVNLPGCQHFMKPLGNRGVYEWWFTGF